MYVQIKTRSQVNKFVLNPFYETSLGRYETVNDEIIVLLENKKDLKPFLANCFDGARATYDRKIGPYNRYYVELLGPVIFCDDTCVVTEDPVASETKVFSLTLYHSQFQNKTHRSDLLNNWVLEGANPTQFNKLLSSKFDLKDNGNGTVTLIKKLAIYKGNKRPVPPNSETDA